MTEEKAIKVSDMIRTTAENNTLFMQQLADHIDKLEDGIIKLQARIEELEKQDGNDIPSQ
jgi:ubiquinone biosynthesis protein UbiJ